MLQVSSRFDNSQVTGAYFIQTIGLFAKLGDGDPVLFEVAQAITPDEMPAQSAVAPSAFVYNMQVTIQQASQLTVTVNPAGTATVQDILTLNATKVDIDGGDISNTIAATFEASNASWPIPAAGETIKVILGKIVKYFTDLNNWRSTVVLIANIVNNCTSTDTNKPLSANQGKVLMDGKAPKNHATNSTTYGGGTASNYGHVKLSDSYTSSGGAASNSVGASSKAVADAYNNLNARLQWTPITFSASSTYVKSGNSWAYRMGQICICSIEFELKTQINAWGKVIIGRVSLPSQMDCFCLCHIQSTGSTAILSIENNNDSSEKGYDIYLEAYNQTISAGEWIRGFLVYFHR